MDKVKCAPLHTMIKTADVSMIGSMASIGLTVALFVSGEAFKDVRLRGESKLGALLSGVMGIVCMGVAKSPLWRISHEGLQKHRHLHGDSAEVALPPRPVDAVVADQLYYKHIIRAHEGAFTTPAHLAEKPALFDYDHERAQQRWVDAVKSVRHAARVSPIGPTRQDTQRNVLAAFTSRRSGDDAAEASMSAQPSMSAQIVSQSLS